jgi:type VI secretion system secreted protein VgrG
MTVATIDTGVDYNNPTLGAGFGPGAKVIAGYNFATNTPDPTATTSQHGTAVAGLIGSTDPNHLGVAPGVKIVALKVVGDNNTADLSNIARAFQWVIDNHAQYNITVVNISLSDGGNYAHNWFAQDGGVGQQITGLINQLEVLNIPVVAATGNSFTNAQGEGFTSIVGGVISVTATDSTDHLLPDAQRLGSTIGMGTATDLAAPGTGFVAPTGDNQYSSVDGTSFATPLVSGAVVLLQQVYQGRFHTLPTVAQVTSWLMQGSDPVFDPVTGITIGRLNIPKAASLIPAPASASLPASAPTPVTTTVSVPISQPSASSPSAPVSVGNVSYVPVTPPQAPAPAPAPVPQKVTPPAPQTQPIQPNPAPSSTPAPAAASTPPDLQVFVNGKLLSSLDPASPSALGPFSQNTFDSMVKAMSAWASSTDNNQNGSAAVNNVRVWNASSQVAGAITTGVAYPAGHLALMSRSRHPSSRSR